MEKFLIVGLGNPGSKYEKTRHNAGFMVIDEVANILKVDLNDSKFNGLYTKTNIKGHQVFLAKPTTYMNLSGEFVARIMNFYEIPIKNLLVIYDDVDTEFGKIKLRTKGSSGGQNGIKNIIAHLKTEEFNRIRVGISRNKLIPLDQHVLSNFKSEEIVVLKSVLTKAANAAIESVGEQFDKIMNKYN